MANEKNAADRVDVQSVEYTAMAERWPKLAALLGGTKAMRDARTDYLPQMEGESKQSYELRLSTSFLFPGLRDSVRQLVAKPFSRDVVVEEPPKFVDEMTADIDGLGRDLTAFGRDVFRSSLVYGATHILIDSDQVPEGEGVSTLRDRKMPRFVHVPAPQLIGWRTDPTTGELAQIRIAETRVEPLGAYGDQAWKYIRVFEPGRWELWREKHADAGDAQYEMVKSGPSAVKQIPLVTFYTQRTGFLTAEPPLEDLAWTNIDHWQSYADHRNILRFCSFAMHYIFGLSPEEITDLGVVGPTSRLKSSNEEASTGYAEPEGKAVGAGRQHLIDLVDQMNVMGMRPMVERSGVETATAKAINEARADTDQQAWISGEEQALRQAFKIAAEFRGETLEDKFAVDISNDFILGRLNTQQMDHLLKSRLAGEISRETYLSEMRRNGMIAESVDVGEEMDRLEGEGNDPFANDSAASGGDASNAA